MRSCGILGGSGYIVSLSSPLLIQGRGIGRLVNDAVAGEARLGWRPVQGRADGR